MSTQLPVKGKAMQSGRTTQTGGLTKDKLNQLSRVASNPTLSSQSSFVPPPPHVDFVEKNRSLFSSKMGSSSDLLENTLKLPTLGLGKYKNAQTLEGMKRQGLNPFNISSNTEDMLFTNELHRGIKLRNKSLKGNLKIWEKSIATQSNRAGVLREINNCGETLVAKKIKKNASVGNLRSRKQSDLSQSQKVNILSEDADQQLAIMDNQQLEKFGKTQSRMSSSHSVSTLPQIGGPKKRNAFLEYIQSQSEHKESVKTYVNTARQILLSQISINDKFEETERLKEFIMMEEEKLEEAKRTFEEDCDKFKRYLEDVENQAIQKQDDVKKLVDYRNDKTATINQLTHKIKEVSSENIKLDEELQTYQHHKSFLDELAEFASKKGPDDKNEIDFDLVYELIEKERARSKVERQATDQLNEVAGDFFLTQADDEGLEDEGEGQEQVELTAEEKEVIKQERIQLKEATDQKFKIYFDRYAIQELLTNLEETNLFLINHVQEEEQNLEETIKQKKQNILDLNKSIEGYGANIQGLKESYTQMHGRQKYLKSNMNIKTGEELKQQQKEQEEWNTLAKAIMDKSQNVFGKSEITGVMDALEQLEIQLEDLSEKREYIEFKSDKSLAILQAKERQINETRKQEKMDKIKEIDKQNQLIKQEQNNARMLKQAKVKVIKGRVNMQRSMKVEVKKKEDDGLKLDQDELDYLRYVGQ